MYEHFNPLGLTDAWWQHLLMLVVAAILGYIIGYRSRKSEIEGLEADLSNVDLAVDDCLKSKKVAVVMPAAATIAPLAVASAMAVTTKADDLKVVEGIGPKIEELLNNNGILTFTQLADTQSERIREILVAAGSRFQIHDPGTWPQQAALARDGKWDELKTWQDELDGGRH